MAGRRPGIGDLAREVGCSPQTVRFYEHIGLLPPAGRSPGNQRLYGAEDLGRLAFIRHARELGFSIEAIRQLISLGRIPEESCAEVHAVARAHLGEVEKRLARLSALRAELRRMIRRCKAGQVGGCHIIEVLADHTHGHCLTGDHDLATESRRRGPRWRQRRRG